MKKLLVVFFFSTIFASTAFAQFSSSASNPTLLTKANAPNSTVSGSLMPDKTKRYYVEFLAGKGDVTIDFSISPKENNGAVFAVTMYRADDFAAKKDNATIICNQHIDYDTKASTKCTFDSSLDKPKQKVVLEFGAYPNAEPVKLNYDIKLSGDWALIPPTKPATLRLPPKTNKSR